MTPIKLVETDSKFLKSVGNCQYDVNGHNWYYVPFWYKEISEGVYEQYSFGTLPKDILDRLSKNREK